MPLKPMEQSWNEGRKGRGEGSRRDRREVAFRSVESKQVKVESNVVLMRESTCQRMHYRVSHKHALKYMGVIALFEPRRTRCVSRRRVGEALSLD